MMDQAVAALAAAELVAVELAAAKCAAAKKVWLDRRCSLGPSCRVPRIDRIDVDTMRR